MATAEAIDKVQRTRDDVLWIFRAGIWKPRTSPATFQGAGEEGLHWLQQVKARFGIPVATEVATPDHVQAALQAGIDYLWIGARTSANPIAVEAIAEAIRTQPHRLSGLFIKNPVNADPALWLGNIERLEKTGLPVMAIHRGCNHQPCWAMAHQVRTARPDIPMLLDPSHMSGDAKAVPQLLSQIEALGLNGAMIEVHCNPSSALSDAKQQISPEDLNLPNPQNIPNPQNAQLNWLRAEIDELDDTLWATIAARMDVSQRIGEWKKAHGVTPLQPERYKQIGERLQRKGQALHLSPSFVEQIWNALHEESLNRQIENGQ